MIKKTILFISAFVIAISSVTFLLHANDRTEASSFNAGRIIDDAIFTDVSMTEAQIQTFLNNINSTCLKNFRTQEPTGGGKYGNNVSVARAIWRVSQEHRINPKVILATLEKEQGLVTRKDCPSWRYNTALGYACPDTGPCDTAAFGFSVQLYQGARHFRGFFDQSPGWIVPYTPGTRYVQYNPNAACGGSNVTIQNRATASLYSYTPYQPNAATRAAAPGQTVNCGAYGNINFWRYFTNWFGSTTNISIPGCGAATNTTLSCVWRLKASGAASDTITTSHEEATRLANTGKYQFSGVDFHARNKVAPRAGNIPVYRLDKRDGSTFLTTNKAEYDGLSNTWSPKGIEFYADPAGANSGYPVWRLYNHSTGAHAWTGNSTTRANLQKNGYTDEGIAFMSLSTVRQETAPNSNQTLVYRFGNMPGNTHFWTTDLKERDSMIRAGYRYEGVAWKASRTKTTKPVYRLYSPTMKKHLFTADANEQRVLSRTSSWNAEGIAFYSAATDTSRPVYRVYLNSNHAHLFTTSAHERNELARTGVGRSEGNAWYQQP